MICSICPRQCNADRSAGTGFCGVGEKYKIARAMPHFWEEPPISGTKGSGAVFFSGCNLRCVFCQNYEVSHEMFGKEISELQLMKIFDRLVALGVHNINLVTPSHYAPMLAHTLKLFNSPIPIVYNTSSYENVDALKTLEGLVDIYLPDIKYFNTEPSAKYSGAGDYFEKASSAVKEMFRQVGQLKTDENGIAVRGMIIRHMLLPGNISQSQKVFEWVADNFSTDTYISLMRQYTPFGEAKNMPPIDRPLSSREYSIAKQKVLDMGFENVFFQQKSSSTEKYIPDFSLQGVD